MDMASKGQRVLLQFNSFHRTVIHFKCGASLFLSRDTPSHNSMAEYYVEQIIFCPCNCVQ